ncbi:MAG: hypothetical protein JRJ70_08795 [Deltaproteobacteria bacterium]|nr:hypothetical protein [Deltaproteobacteria bacterium]
MSEKIFIDGLITPFYQELDLNYRNTFLRGQIYWTHVCYTTEHLELWRPVNSDDTRTWAREFAIAPAGADAFDRSTPLYTPKLEINEELIVVRAKRRPVVLISPVPQEIETDLVRRGAPVYKNICVVAPLHRIFDPNTGRPKFSEDFITRARLMEFP